MALLKKKKWNFYCFTKKNFKKKQPKAQRVDRKKNTSAKKMSSFLQQPIFLCLLLNCHFLIKL